MLQALALAATSRTGVLVSKTSQPQLSALTTTCGCSLQVPPDGLTSGVRPFYDTLEDVYLSLRSAMWRVSVHRQQPGRRQAAARCSHAAAIGSHKIRSLALH